MAQINAVELLTPERFDLAAKLIYGRFLEEELNSSWGMVLYGMHLGVWNDVKELKPKKEGLSEYITSYKKILEDTKKNRFDYLRSPVYINNRSIMINGSHRTAAGILYGKKVGIKTAPDNTGEATATYDYFRNKKDFIKTGLTNEYTDAMAVEYSKWKNVYIATVFRPHDQKKMKDIFRKYGQVAYDKEIKLKNDGPFFLMTQLYLGEHWLGNLDQAYGGAKDKAIFCFPDTNRKIWAYMIDGTDGSRMRDCKNEIRNIFGIGNHSIHINDTKEESTRLVNILFNDNSIHFLNHARFKKFKKFHGLLDRYRKFVTGSDHFAVDASSVLSAYGIREGADLDFLAKKTEGNYISTIHSEIRMHNEELKNYTRSLDDLLYNPTNHFWFNGVKFVSLDIIKEMKQKRGEEKDRRDVQLIEEFLKERE